ncbi:hypothetical protein HKD37_11G030667 [Glycine soja]
MDATASSEAGNEFAAPVSCRHIFTRQSANSIVDKRTELKNVNTLDQIILQGSSRNDNVPGDNLQRARPRHQTVVGIQSINLI